MSEETVSAAPTEGAASEILASTATDTSAPAAETPAADAPPAVDERAAHNKRLIEAERLRRRAASERQAAEADRRAAEQAREEAKKLAEERSGGEADMAKLVREARGNPAKFHALLEATGMTLDDYVRWKVSDGEVSPDLQMKTLDASLRDEIKAARDEVAAIRKERDDEKAAREAEHRNAKAQEAEAFFRNEIDTVLKADPDKYELTLALEEQGEVFELMRGYYQQSGGKRALTPAVAAEMIENHLRARTSKAANTKYYASLVKNLATQSTPVAPDTKAAPGKAPPAKHSDARAKTASALTNNLVTSPASPAPDAQPLESREEFVARQKERLRNAKKEAAATAKK